MTATTTNANGAPNLSGDAATRIGHHEDTRRLLLRDNDPQPGGIALSYPWKHYIGGRLGRLGTRDDVTLHQQHVADIVQCAQAALGSVDPTRTSWSTGRTCGQR